MTVNLAAMIAEAVINGETYEQPTINPGTVGMDADVLSLQSLIAQIKNIPNKEEA